MSQKQDNVGLFIPAGIHENVQLDEVKIKQTSAGVEILELTYKKDNRKCYQTEWLHPSDPIEQQEKVASRILCVLKVFFSKEVIDKIEAENIVDLAKKTALALSSVKDKTLLRMKFVYNDGKEKSMVSTPRYSKFTWIEPMTIPANESKIQWLANIDKDAPTKNVVEKDEKR